MTSTLVIRRAGLDDAEQILSILQGIAVERVHSAIDRPWTLGQFRSWMAALSEREIVHVAVPGAGRIVAYQTLDLWASSLVSMSHVGQLGTFVAPEWRKQGVGCALFRATEQFARIAGYAKLVIYVRGSNAPAQRFYEGLGFRACGRLTRQVRIDGHEDDEILMELFL